MLLMAQQSIHAITQCVRVITRNSRRLSIDSDATIETFHMQYHNIALVSFVTTRNDNYGGQMSHISALFSPWSSTTTRRRRILVNY